MRVTSGRWVAQSQPSRQEIPIGSCNPCAQRCQSGAASAGLPTIQISPRRLATASLPSGSISNPETSIGDPYGVGTAVTLKYSRSALAISGDIGVNGASVAGSAIARP